MAKSHSARQIGYIIEYNCHSFVKPSTILLIIQSRQVMRHHSDQFKYEIKVNASFHFTVAYT